MTLCFLCWSARALPPSAPSSPSLFIILSFESSLFPPAESMQRYLADERFQLALQVGLGMSVKGDEPEAGAAAPGEGAAASHGGEPAPAAEAAEPMQRDAAQPPAPEPEPERSEEEWELLNK